MQLSVFEPVFEFDALVFLGLVLKSDDNRVFIMICTENIKHLKTSC